jgi:3'(2'),5'-bisphosphate nucleotidase
MSRDSIAFELDQCAPNEIAFFLAEAALAAGPAVMEEYERGCQAQSKQDGSPVTAADHRAEKIICEQLARITPHIDVVAEESTAAGAPIRTAKRFLLVDPLDGTKEFLAGNGEFTLNVALVEDGVPIAGVVYAPALGKIWVGASDAFVGEVALGASLPAETKLRRIATRSAPSGLVACASRSHRDPHTEAFLTKLSISEERNIGSSLKFCLIAEGSADVYPRFGPTMEWDTAAGHAVLRAAGGVVLSGDGKLSYGKFDSGLRNGSFVAWGDPSAAARVAES